MKKPFLNILLIAFSCFTSNAQTVLFSEDFSSDDSQTVSVTSLNRWNVLYGNLDIYTFITSENYTGKSIDLAGTENSSIETKSSITLSPGTYEFSFLSKDNLYGNSSVKIEIGTIFSDDFSALPTISTYSKTFVVATTTTVKIKLTETGPSNNGGTFIGDIKLTNTSLTTDLENSNTVKQSINMYPNPSQGTILLEGVANCDIDVINNQGIVEFSQYSPQNKTTLSTTLNSGSYTVKIAQKESGKTTFKKLVVAK